MSCIHGTVPKDDTYLACPDSMKLTSQENVFRNKSHSNMFQRQNAFIIEVMQLA